MNLHKEVELHPALVRLSLPKTSSAWMSLPKTPSSVARMEFLVVTGGLLDRL